jgi:hypothetical protein
VIVRLALWSLADSKTTVGELRRHLRDEAVDASEADEGLRLELWISNEGAERWGSISLFDSAEAAERAAAGGASELIGKPPDVFEEFDLEASIEGRSAVDELSRLGLAFEDA